MLGLLDDFELRLGPRIMLVHDAHLFRDRLNNYSPIDHDNNVHHSSIRSQKQKNKLISSPSTISA